MAPRLRRGEGARGRGKRVLYVHSRKASFVAIDREILAERYEIEDLYQPGRLPNPLRVLRGVLRADLVFGWFASWHTFFPVTLASLLRKPAVMIIGGFDTANMPDIGYGYQQGGLRRWASRWIMNRATESPNSALRRIRWKSRRYRMSLASVPATSVCHPTCAMVDINLLDKPGNSRHAIAARRHARLRPSYVVDPRSARR